MAAAAILAFLLHGAATAPAGHHVATDVVSLGADDHLHREAADHYPDLPLADVSCCGIACSITLLPLAAEITTHWSRAIDGATLIQGKPGIEPEGIRRPPKSVA